MILNKGDSERHTTYEKHKYRTGSIAAQNVVVSRIEFKVWVTGIGLTKGEESTQKLFQWIKSLI